MKQKLIREASGFVLGLKETRQLRINMISSFALVVRVGENMASIQKAMNSVNIEIRKANVDSSSIEEKKVLLGRKLVFVLFAL